MAASQRRMNSMEMIVRAESISRTMPAPMNPAPPKIVTIISLPPEPAMPNSQTCSCTAFLKKSGA